MIWINFDILIVVWFVFDSFVVGFVWSAIDCGQIILVALIEFKQNFLTSVKLDLFWIHDNLLFPHVIGLHWFSWALIRWWKAGRKRFETRLIDYLGPVQCRLGVIQSLCFGSICSLICFASLELSWSFSWTTFPSIAIWSIQLRMVKSDIWIFKFIIWITLYSFAKFFRCVLIDIEWILISTRITCKGRTLFIFIIITCFKRRSWSNQGLIVFLFTNLVRIIVNILIGNSDKSSLFLNEFIEIAHLLFSS